MRTTPRLLKVAASGRPRSGREGSEARGAVTAESRNSCRSIARPEHPSDAPMGRPASPVSMGPEPESLVSRTPPEPLRFRVRVGPTTPLSAHRRFQGSSPTDAPADWSHTGRRKPDVGSSLRPRPRRRRRRAITPTSHAHIQGHVLGFVTAGRRQAKSGLGRTAERPRRLASRPPPGRARCKGALANLRRFDTVRDL